MIKIRQKQTGKTVNFRRPEKVWNGKTLITKWRASCWYRVPLICPFDASTRSFVTFPGGIRSFIHVYNIAFRLFSVQASVLDARAKATGGYRVSNGAFFEDFQVLVRSLFFDFECKICTGFAEASTLHVYIHKRYAFIVFMYELSKDKRNIQILLCRRKVLKDFISFFENLCESSALNSQLKFYTFVFYNLNSYFK